jgi:hypothetical protein
LSPSEAPEVQFPHSALHNLPLFRVWTPNQKAPLWMAHQGGRATYVLEIS